MTPAYLMSVFGVATFVFPAFGFLALATAVLVGRKIAENTVRRLSTGLLAASLVASLLTLTLAWFTGPDERVVVPVGSWFTVSDYSLASVLVIDAPGSVLMLVSTTLCMLISVFSGRYLHREEGFNRFFMLLLLFALGMLAIACGGSVDILFGGWELVGLTSALLIAFFHERIEPVRHGLRAFAVCRTADVALLSGAVLLHHEAGSGIFHTALPAVTESGSPMATWIALLFLVGAMGKAASLPFTGWLPRAMEGPTPSSAIFYGALSIHAGPFLLIRVAPLLEASPIARGSTLVVGLVTALHATMVGRAQTDIKSKLAYASVSQVGLIFVEIAFGLYTLALVHMAGHATLRTWELLRAPSLLEDRRELMKRVGGAPGERGMHIDAITGSTLRRILYRFSIERWFLDDLVRARILAPIARLLRRADSWDRGVASALDGSGVGRSGGGPRKMNEVAR